MVPAPVVFVCGAALAALAVRAPVWAHTLAVPAGYPALAGLWVLLVCLGWAPAHLVVAVVAALVVSCRSLSLRTLVVTVGQGLVAAVAAAAVTVWVAWLAGTGYGWSGPRAGSPAAGGQGGGLTFQATDGSAIGGLGGLGDVGVVSLALSAGAGAVVLVGLAAVAAVCFGCWRGHMVWRVGWLAVVPAVVASLASVCAVVVAVLLAQVHPAMVGLMVPPAAFVVWVWWRDRSSDLAGARARALLVAGERVNAANSAMQVRHTLETAARQVTGGRSAAVVSRAVPAAAGELRVPFTDTEVVVVVPRSRLARWSVGDVDAVRSLSATASAALRRVELTNQMLAITSAQGESVVAVACAHNRPDQVGADEAAGQAGQAGHRAEDHATGSDEAAVAEPGVGVGAGVDVVTFANPSAADLFCGVKDADPANLVGAALTDLVHLLNGRDGSRLEPTAHEYLMAGHTYRNDDVLLVRPDGSQVPVALTFSPMATGTGVLVLRDVSERKAMQDRLAYQANHDELTGLLNRRAFADLLDEVMEAAAAQAHLPGDQQAPSHAVLFADLDRFKLVNDSYGHPAGDELLRQVAGRVSALLRRGDVLARQSGDEFVMLLRTTSLDGACKVAGRVVDELSRPFVIDGHPVVIGVSVGVTMTSGCVDRRQVMAAADAAAYEAKSAGRGCYRVSTEEGADELARYRLEMQSAMHAGLAAGDFQVHYQPIVDTRTGVMVGTEALVRWLRDGVMVPPGDFIEMAEDTGFIVELGRWVLRVACEQTQQWNAAHLTRSPLSVSVNLSALQFTRTDVVGDVTRALDASGLPAHLLCLEITESLLMARAETVTRTLAVLRELGVRLAVDDFGTGYSSLAYLQRFPVDTVKVDRSFTAGLGSDAVASELVAAVVRLAGALGMRVVAEGVEDDVQWAALEDLGCPQVQGFRFARPLPAGVLPRFWAGNLAAPPTRHPGAGAQPTLDLTVRQSWPLAPAAPSDRN